jgi:transcriptional regulator with XRE-family HTH domain
MTVDFKAIGKRVKSCRLKKEMTQAELAERAELSNVYVSNIETGVKEISLEVFMKIADALGLSLDELAFGKSSAHLAASVVKASTEADTEVKLTPEKLESLLLFCETVRNRKEMQAFCGIKTDEYFRKSIIVPMLTLGLIKMMIPDKPSSPKQKYVRNG